MMVIALCVIVGLAVIVYVAACVVQKELDEDLPGGIEEYQGEDET